MMSTGYKQISAALEELTGIQDIMDVEIHLPLDDLVTVTVTCLVDGERCVKFLREVKELVPLEETGEAEC